MSGMAYFGANHWMMRVNIQRNVCDVDSMRVWGLACTQMLRAAIRSSLMCSNPCAHKSRIGCFRGS
jgi:hypothetical protein